MPKSVAPVDISAMPEYQELLAKRRAVAIPLTVLMLVIYYAFILMVAYAPDMLHQPIGEGVTSLGIVLGLGVILVTLAVTGFYVWYANTRIEPIVATIQRKAGGQ